MKYYNNDYNDIFHQNITRRNFIGMAALTALAGITGCAANPVTGERNLILISPDEEIEIDITNAPHQFSADFGAVQDRALQSYIQEVTDKMGAHTHRPELPYSGTALNASYVNGYTFPGGTMGLTRGLLVKIEDEATLAGLIGHELGHVNARHTAQRMTTGVFASIVIAGLGAAAGAKDERYMPLVMGLGGIGAGALLAKYSRGDERQADELGMEYMVRSGYSPQGMISLMNILVSLGKSKPGAIEMMFSSHPMSGERYKTAVKRAQSDYASSAGLPVKRERYMDHTAGIRRQTKMIDHIQKGDSAMQAKKLTAAEAEYNSAIKLNASDYEALMKMAICQANKKNMTGAQGFVSQARQAYAAEPLSYQMGGLIALNLKQFERAHNDFVHYKKILPGNPMSLFLNGRSLEGMNRRKDSAEEYRAFLKQVQSGDEADYARMRLTEWGYL